MDKKLLKLLGVVLISMFKINFRLIVLYLPGSILLMVLLRYSSMGEMGSIC